MSVEAASSAVKVSLAAEVSFEVAAIASVDAVSLASDESSVEMDSSAADMSLVEAASSTVDASSVEMDSAAAGVSVAVVDSLATDVELSEAVASTFPSGAIVCVPSTEVEVVSDSVTVAAKTGVVARERVIRAESVAVRNRLLICFISFFVCVDFRRLRNDVIILFHSKIKLTI